MSKIYKALEKAEREREKVNHSYSLSVTEGGKEPKREREEPKENVLSKGDLIFDHKLISLSQPGSLAAEQFRKLRTQLFQLLATNPPRTIMVTSATSGEGKTFLAANLAVNIATHFHIHALLVDCDLRAPQVARWFNLQNGKGLSDYLTGEANLSSLFMKTKIEKLSVIPGGSIRDNPTELIGSKRMEALVRELATRYKDRFVIFDTTPLLATSEPEVLSKLVDGIIVVIRAGSTPRETVKQAISSLEKEKVLGFVLNGLVFKSSSLSERYFGSDGYYYRYGYGREKSNGQSRWGIRIPFLRKGESKG